ncbi:MAG TPA: site-2 protease family protein [Terriglobales bacterium]|nr:site-2 protease family protein [Terriglobales bacterium]
MPPALLTILSTTVSAVLSLIAVAWWYIAAWAVICVVWWAIKAERFGITGPPYLLIYRTSRLNAWIEKLSSRNPIAWRTIWNMGIVTGFGLMILAFDFLIKNLSLFLTQSPQASPLQPIVAIPGVGVSFETFPYLVVALSILLASHELSHGIASLVDHIPLKSTGLIFAHLVMGGFVEPVEEKLNQARNLSKLRVFAAGSFTNAVLGILVIFLLFNFPSTTALFYNHGGVTINSISPSLPVHDSGLNVGDVVTNINGTRIADVVALRSYMQSVYPGQRVLLATPRGNFLVKTSADPSNSTHALIGISLDDAYSPKLPFLPANGPQVVQREESWLATVLVSVAFINMLPLAPFDGDKFLETVLNIFGINRTKEIRTIAGSISLAILLLNFFLSYQRFGFLRF